jgi:3-hydroxymyristoyl/3-hydroxydecanoyl-(acyl carrier protein) dehydratase
MTCAPVDFTRLVDRVYEDGARIFVEVGPQRTCTRWIDKILGDRPHAAMAIDRKNAPDALSILGVLAGLVSHQMPVDLSLLYQEPAVSTPALPEVEQHDAVQESNIRQRVPVPAPVSSAAAALRETTGHLAHDHMLRDAAIHRAFLGARQTGMADLSGLIRTQMDAYGALLGHIPAGRRVQFDEDAVRAFAQGSPMRCFGALFEPFKGRRVPRIPNGSFRFLDRVPVVDGPKGIVEVGRTLTGECGVSTDAWFLLPDGIAPHAILMEMGMQPCGFLSAYMGSTRHHPDTDFYFRNLDGEAVLLRPIDLRGRTVTSRVTLRASTAVGNAIVQTFGFTLACGGEDFYTGEATFGYFTRATLDARAGLDGGEEITPWLRRSSGINGWTPPLSYEQMPARLSFLRDVRVVDDGGTYRNGYAHAFLDVPPDAWFFARHFYEDPVMPGSLGVEAMQSALGTCAYAQIEPSGTVLPRLTTPRDVQTRWRYRGQIVPDDLRDEVPLHLEVHVIEREVDSARVWARGEGSLWKGKLRIYEVDDLAVELPLH